METETIAQLVPSESDKAIAERLKQRIVEAHRPIMDLVEEAARHGMMVNFQMSRNQFGRLVCEVKIIKELT